MSTVEEKKIDRVEEPLIAVAGNVDSGKTSSVGVLTTGELDDGNGKARLNVFVHPHEKESGRTSDMGHAYYKTEDQKRIINFIDLAGHERYLKTTIRGITTYHPDYGMVCAARELTHMTREHVRLLTTIGVPFMFVVTKTDITPPDVMGRLIESLKNLAKRAHKMVYEVRSEKDFEVVQRSINHLVPLIRTSNVTGHNIDLLKSFLSQVVRKREHKYVPAFVIDHIYKVAGFGTVISGITGIDIRVGDELYIGPWRRGSFERLRVRTLHNDYREFVDMLPAGSRGCIWFKLLGGIDKERKQIRSGMIVSLQPQPTSRFFEAEVTIFHHSTSVRKGYVAFVNMGAIREPVKFHDIVGTLRTGDRAKVRMEFLKHFNYIKPGTSFFFREGQTRGIGKVLNVEEHSHTNKKSIDA